MIKFRMEGEQFWSWGGAENAALPFGYDQVG